MQKDVTDSQAKGFALRLREALELRGKRRSPTGLEREFNLRYRGSPVSMHATRKWLQGLSVPTQDKMEVLAAWLDVPADWLRWGVVPADKPSKPPATPTSAGPSPVPSRAQQHRLSQEREHSLLQDWRLLEPRNQKVVRALIEILLHEQRNVTKSKDQA